MALIETTRQGRPYYIVRWNYRDKSLDGKPYDERSFRKASEAKAWDRKVNRQQPGAGSGRVRVHHIVDEWLELHVSTLEQRTRKDYEQAARLRIRPGIGPKVADKLTPLDASRWVRTMQETGTEAPTVNKTLRIAKAMLRWARSEGMTTCTALEDTRGVRDRRPREERRQQARAYTDSEIDDLVAACPLMIEKTVILVGKDSGLRRSELFALGWDCVDLRGEVIHVRRALDADGSFKDPKTHERRTVPLLRDGVKALREWRKHAPKTELVFTQADGRPLQTVWESRHAGQYKTRRNGERYLTDGIRKRSGIHLELNHLRDTYASALLFDGEATDADITMALGHKSVQTTRDHYADWFEPRRDTLAERINRKRDERRRASHR